MRGSSNLYSWHGRGAGMLARLQQGTAPEQHVCPIFVPAVAREPEPPGSFPDPCVPSKRLGEQQFRDSVLVEAVPFGVASKFYRGPTHP